MNAYAVLRVSPDATPDQLRTAYRQAMRATHPDLAGPSSAGEAQRVNEAYAILTDPVRKADHDRALRADSASSRPPSSSTASSSGDREQPEPTTGHQQTTNTTYTTTTTAEPDDDPADEPALPRQPRYRARRLIWVGLLMAPLVLLTFRVSRNIQVGQDLEQVLPAFALALAVAVLVISPRRMSGLACRAAAIGSIGLLPAATMPGNYVADTLVGTVGWGMLTLMALTPAAAWWLRHELATLARRLLNRD